VVVPRVSFVEGMRTTTCASDTGAPLAPVT